MTVSGTIIRQSLPRRLTGWCGLVVLGVAITGASAQAADDKWQYCGPAPLVKPELKPELKSELKPGSVKAGAQSAPSTAMRFTADEASVEAGQYQLQGHVIGGRGDQHLEADRLRYNEQTDQAQAEGQVRYSVGDRLLVGDSATLNLGNDTGKFSPARFWLTDRHIRGKADSVTLQSQTVTDLNGAQFTTCDEGDNAWLLKASELRLDSAANEGVARHARVEFMHVPIFYFPYLSFPLQGRKTGFLAPAFGESTVAGTELSVPWYWNIAPDRDATLTPRLMTRRGVLMEGEFRYLNEHNHGQVELAQLSNDRMYGTDRRALTLNHLGEPAAGWRTQLDYRYISDSDYLDDFGNGLSVASATHLERRGELQYQAEQWRASLLVQGFQTLDKTLPVSARPYQRLPQLQLSTAAWRGPAGLELALNAEAVKFDRAAGIVGNRLDLQPSLSWPLRGAAGFLLPKLSWRYTQYALTNNDPTSDAHPTRSLPLFNIDSGLVFERELSGGKRQTLEPRLYYLYVPKKDQTDLIVDQSSVSRVFDSSLPLFGMDQLFRDNRFNGGDRVGDANQLSSALSTRFFDAGGRELLSASLGRIFYFRDREVTLPGGSIDTARASDWIAELKSQWTASVSARTSLQWDTKNHELSRGTLDWRYQQDTHRVLRLAYRFERDTLKQVDVAGIWPITPRWHAVGRWLRSIKDQTTLETLKGLEYESCCWAVRVVQRSYRVDAADETLSRSIWLQLELKGLTSVGRKVENLLARDILAP